MCGIGHELVPSGSDVQSPLPSAAKFKTVTFEPVQTLNFRVYTSLIPSDQMLL